MTDNKTGDGDTGYTETGKSRLLAAVLAFCLGGLGIHKFYLGQRKVGAIYLLFSWTAIPLLIGWFHALHYIDMGNEEFHRRLTMETDDFQEWKEENREAIKEWNEQREVSRKKGKSRVLAIILAVWLGLVGAHRFYLGEKEMGKKYLMFSVLGVPAIAGWIDAVNYLFFQRGDRWEEYLESENLLDKNNSGTVGKAEEKEKELSELPDNYIEEAKGGYVTRERVMKVADILDEEETVYYITRGSTVDVEGSPAGSSLFGDDRSRKTGTKGWVRAVYTDKRVAVKVPQVLGGDERSVPYHSITSVDLDTGLQTKRFSLQTPGQTYHIEAHDPGKDECREIVRFVREKIAEANQSESVVTQEADPTEQLQNLQELHEEGVISSKEFEEKREQLVQKIE